MSQPARKSPNHAATALSLVAVVVGMSGLAFASKPLYSTFCRITGFGGTTQTAQAAPGAAAENTLITVQFDANVNVELPWTFRPVQNAIKVRPGVETLAFYEATNTSSKPIVGTAVFNVAPFKMGSYFSKIECFCFTEQVLEPGETAIMPVTFFVDPDMLADANTADVRTLTLSYTFFASDDQSAAAKLHAKASRKPADNG